MKADDIQGAGIPRSTRQTWKHATATQDEAQRHKLRFCRSGKTEGLPDRLGSAVFCSSDRILMIVRFRSMPTANSMLCSFHVCVRLVVEVFDNVGSKSRRADLAGATKGLP